MTELRTEATITYLPPPEKLKWQMYATAGLLDNINGADKAVLACLIGHANTKTGRCDPSQERIAAMTRLDTRAVRRSIANLVKAGLLGLLRRGRVGRGGRATNAYQVNWQRLRQAFAQYEERGKLAGQQANSRVIRGSTGKQTGQKCPVTRGQKCPVNTGQKRPPNK